MRKWNRREFNRNGAALALFSPFLSLLDPAVARAQAGGGEGPAKYLLIMTANGTDPDAWESGSMTQVLNNNNDVIRASRFNSNGSAGNHGSIGALTGTGSYGGQVKSLDIFVADDLRSRNILTQVPSLHLGGVEGQSGVSFTNNSLLRPQYSTSQAFSSVFDGVVAPAPTPVQQPANNNQPAQQPPASDAEIRAMRRISILDTVKAELAILKNGLGTIERVKLDLHTDSIRQLEERIGQQLATLQAQALAANPGDQGGNTGGVAAPAAPSFVQPVSCQQPSLQGGLQDVENSVVHMELAVAAFSCDITRVAHVEFGHHQACNINLPQEQSQGDWHNDFMHSGQRGQDLINLENWLSERFVDTIERLKGTSAPDGRGSLYDQTYILWVREMGNAIVHQGDNMPYVIAGGAGGYLTGNRGRLINGGGASHQQILLSAAESMGATNYGAFGTGDSSPFGGLRG